MTRPLLPYILIIITLIIDFSCANRVPPTGGIKDINPPRLLLATPPNGAVNVPLDGIITLRFDEFAVIQNANEILISPLLAKQPEFKLRGKNILIDFQDDLRPNTTYTIFFGENLKDLNEGNIAHNFEYSFSTGSTRDSLSIRGKVLAAQSKQAAKGIYIALYDGNSADTAFLTTPPLYITRTDEAGQYKLSNIAANTYRIFALEDKNNNYYYDQPNEQIAFSDSLIKVVPITVAMPRDSTNKANSTDSLAMAAQIAAQNLANSQAVPVLYLFNEGKEAPQVAEKKNREYGYALLLMTKPIDSLAISAIDTLPKTNDWQHEITPKGDTVFIWYKNVPSDAEIAFALRGAANYADTVYFKSMPEAKTLPILKFTSSIRMGRSSTTFDPNQKMWIEFNAPLLAFDKDSVTLSADGINIPISSQLNFDAQYPRRLYIDYAWKSQVKYELNMPDSAAVDFWGQANERINIKFASQTQSQLGAIQLKCSGFDPNKSYILQVKDGTTGKKMLIQQNLKTAQTLLDQIVAGTYQIAIIEDRNKNGKWDTGNYSEHLQPEKIYNTTEAITVKGNWDTEVEISLE